jgi:hypothetical protein
MYSALRIALVLVNKNTAESSSRANARSIVIAPFSPLVAAILSSGPGVHAPDPRLIPIDLWAVASREGRGHGEPSESTLRYDGW